MHKIYTRYRFRIPNLDNKRLDGKKKSKIAKIFLIMAIATLTVKTVLDAILPIFDNLCENKAKSIATIISNEQATEVMKVHTYEELYSIEKDDAGNIKMIKANIIPINQITSELAVKIQNAIDKKGRENIGIALRKFYRFKIISWKGT